MSPPPLLVVAGPTGAGKSAVAIAIARRFDAVVVSADAMQVYAGMDVGTAKVPRAERLGVPHYGLDVVLPDEDFDVASFLELVDAARRSHERVVVVGGTHFYLAALVRGLVDLPRPDPALRAALEREPDLHGWLARVDPALALRLAPRDRVRLVRGLEVVLATGVPLSEHHRRHQLAPVATHVVGLTIDRADLDERIDQRIVNMDAEGYRDEVEGLLAAGYTRSLRSMRSLGYRHVARAVAEGTSWAAALDETARDTRRFARKQRTWLRSLGWPALDGASPDRAVDAAGRLWGAAR